MLTVTYEALDSKISYMADNDIGYRIKQARLAFRPRKLTQQQLADLVNVSRPAVTQWETGETKSLDGENLHRVAAALRVSIEWLLYGRGSGPADQPPVIYEPSNVLPGPPIRGMVPIISWVSAGRWREPDVALDEPLEWLPVTFKTPNVFGLRVDGDSMEPDFPPGTIIFVDPDRKAEAMNLVIALNGDDEATFKRLTKEGGVWYLTPLNPRYPLQKLDSLCKIIGVVIMASRWTV
ncbi:putative Repressor protein C2 [Candidatus Competibacter denitrificans Run_A_D11]|uniref:Repressor protein C2 n=1 Tax=Candidatus Competibacter denitrificans Run_A_D11 TaxID=1400863 RepID=W6ME79_9GAMM|nr:S24 family peptidase [Candidatus Competibacter denitrificans]CDI04143.1 putative Repressor protein C2 [Candidatus Competibacter denitrificans Run_A_D11]HAS86784.1 helix-turn-helix domain-containing protein [Candidatus Competibacteraceae bacterium]HRC69996.1 S24 family peptidase [Candidatus Competibacter denitrificans]